MGKHCTLQVEHADSVIQKVLCQYLSGHTPPRCASDGLGSHVASKCWVDGVKEAGLACSNRAYQQHTGLVYCFDVRLIVQDGLHQLLFLSRRKKMYPHHPECKHKKFTWWQAKKDMTKPYTDDEHMMNNLVFLRITKSKHKFIYFTQTPPITVLQVSTYSAVHLMFLQGLGKRSSRSISEKSINKNRITF